MAELRKDYILDEYVIIAKERAKRPDQFKTDGKKRRESSKNCPFCPKNESMIPGVIEEYPDKRWIVRAIPNKFGAVTKQGNVDLRTDNEFYTFADAVGSHEVIIETPKHNHEIHELSEEQIVHIIDMYLSRIKANLADQRIRYPSLFKNKGVKAGASIAHSHTQLIGYNIVPKRIREQSQASKEYYDSTSSCAYCKIIEKERNSFRQIEEDEHFFVLSPYASQYAMQFNIIPKRHMSSMLEINENEKKSLARILKKHLSKLETLSNPSYNILFNNFYEENHYDHFYISVAPRLNTWAGFEKLTGTIINPVPPEEAARFYRE